MIAQRQIANALAGCCEYRVDEGRSKRWHTGFSNSTGSIINGCFDDVRVHVHRALADRPHVITALEMGGTNALVVWDVSDLRAAAYATIQSAYLTAGQRCSCARRLIVQSGAKGEQFLGALTAMIARIRVGRYDEQPEPFTGPVISPRAAERLLEAQDELIANGGSAIVRMRPMNDAKTLLTPGLLDVQRVRDLRDE